MKFLFPHGNIICGVGRAPQGARGLKSEPPKVRHFAMGRAPQGARGLKSEEMLPEILAETSRPARGAWVEISAKAVEPRTETVAPRKGRVG